jgi:hypothetical protein
MALASSLGAGEAQVAGAGAGDHAPVVDVEAAFLVPVATGGVQAFEAKPMGSNSAWQPLHAGSAACSVS